MGKTSEAVPVLSVCCVCKHVAPSDSPSSSWTPMTAFLERHQLRLIDVRLSHTYCPVCYARQAEAWSIPIADGDDRNTPRAA
jgi:hypothetical protein